MVGPAKSLNPIRKWTKRKIMLQNVHEVYAVACCFSASLTWNIDMVIFSRFVVPVTNRYIE